MLPAQDVKTQTKGPAQPKHGDGDPKATPDNRREKICVDGKRDDTAPASRDSMLKVDPRLDDRRDVRWDAILKMFKDEI